MAGNNQIQNVAIVGASGHLGRHFAEELVKTGHNVTALTRSDKKGSLSEGVTTAVIDYNDEDSLVAALTGKQFLIITLSTQAPPETHSLLIRAAVKAQVPYVMPNAYGSDIENKTLAKEEMYTGGCASLVDSIKGSGIDYVALCCGFWYEWGLALGDPAFGIDIANRKVTFFDHGNTMVNTSTWRQCGRAVASLLSLPQIGNPGVSQWKNKLLYISSFRISQRDMLDSIHRVMGSTDADWQITYQPSSERNQEGLTALQQGNPVGYAKAMYSRLFYPNGDSDYESSKGIANGVLSLPQEDLDEATKTAVDMVSSGWNPFA